MTGFPTYRFVNLRIVFTVTILLKLTSCDIFDPRSPEDPLQTRSSFRPATTAEIVIDNFTGAISERNTQNYILCFADPDLSDRTFEFIPTQDAIRQYGGLFDEWGTREERSYFENLLSRVPQQATMRLDLSQPLFESMQSDSAVYRANYTLTANHSDDGFSSTVFSGTMRLSLATDRTNTWSIHRWTDLKFEDTPSWSDVKGRFVN